MGFFKKSPPPSFPSGDLEEIARKKGYGVQELWPSKVEHRLPTRTIPEQMQETLLFSSPHTQRGKNDFELRRLTRLYAGEYYPVPSVLLVTIPDAIVHVPSGMAFTPDGVALVGSTPTYDPSVPPQFPTSSASLPRLAGDWLSLSSLWGSNYAHWLMDTLPRLSALEHCPPETRLLFRGTLASFQTGSLDLLGIPLDRFELSPDTFVRVERLHALRCGAVTGVPHRGPISWLRSRLLKAVSAEPTSGLFISRSQTTTRSKALRNILNEPDLLATASRYGVEPIFSEKLPFADQIRAFAGCSAVMGSHGAGIYNLLFAPEGTPVIELYSWTYWEHAACRLSSLLGMPHYHLFSHASGAEGNITVDPSRFEKLLQHALRPGEASPEKVF